METAGVDTDSEVNAAAEAPAPGVTNTESGAGTRSPRHDDDPAENSSEKGKVLRAHATGLVAVSRVISFLRVFVSFFSAHRSNTAFEFVPGVH